ncbi:MAG: plasmid mobilization relaxosome protein MobC [Lachnospiraceae bacterium]|nr:plasmid mobilization relaxosome protein MobC [Lachnospiraceae bacterium]
MATELVELRIRLSEKKRERLKILKTEFGFKSMSKLVNIFIDSGFERIEDKFHFIDKEQGDEIKKIIMQIANDVHDIKLNLSRIGSNINQIARATNMGMNVSVNSRSGSSSSDAMLIKDIEFYKSRLERLEKDGDLFDEIPKLKKMIAEKEAKLKPQIPEIDMVGGENVSVDDIKNLSKELTEASEKLGKELWKILS